MDTKPTSINSTRAARIGEALEVGRKELVAELLSRLSARERLILKAIAAGSTNKEIAKDLKMSLNAVNLKVRLLLARTNTRNRAALAALAARCDCKRAEVQQ